MTDKISEMSREEFKEFMKEINIKLGIKTIDINEEWRLFRKRWHIDLRKLNPMNDQYTLLALEKAFKEGFERGQKNKFA